MSIRKKVCRTIKLRRYKSKINEESIKQMENNEFIVCFEDNKYLHCFDTFDLKRHLEKDHIRRILYIFDITDRIVIDRKVLFSLEDIVEE